MGFWKAAGKLALGATGIALKGVTSVATVAYKGTEAAAKKAYDHREEIAAGARIAGRAAAKATVAVSSVAYRGVSVAAKVVYDHREEIGSAANATVRVAAKATGATAGVAYKATAATAQAIYDNRDAIAGATAGVARGTADAARDLSGHLVSKKALSEQVRIVEAQGRRYRELTGRLRTRLSMRSVPRAVLLDSLVVGGQALSAYANSGTLPADVQLAYELAYPGLAAARSFSDEVQHLDREQLVGFASGIKGKLFEIKYVDYLNDGNLPEGFHARLAAEANNPGWDIAIDGPDGAIRDTIQAKATDSAAYVAQALKENPGIDVVTTSEVHSHLVMQGFSDHVIDSGVSDAALTSIVEGGMDGAAVSMHWTPSAVSLALIAFSAYNQEGLSSYQKSRQFGERSLKSYLAYLAGGGLAVLTNTWWLGVIGGMGSRLLLGSGRVKRERLAQLKQMTTNNEAVLRRLAGQLNA